MVILISLLIPIVILVFLVTPKKLYIIIKTLPDSLQLFKIFTSGVSECVIDIFLKKHSVPSKFRQIAQKNRYKVAIYFEDQKWTFGEIDEFSNKIARYFKSTGLKRGDGVALLLDNCPEFICLWLGLAKLGIVTALINTNLKTKEALDHAIRSGKAERIIYGSRFQSLIQSTKTILPGLISYEYNDISEDISVTESSIDLKSELSKTSSDPVDEDIDAVQKDDILFYIYTSGTTGLPKATLIKNYKGYIFFKIFQKAVSMTNEDCVYVTLPLYHGLGTMIGVSQALLGGSSVVIRKKFSASNFWSDLEKYKCTASLYIGEMIRYVLAAERNSKKRNTYTLKKLLGNGMKPSTWKELIDNHNVEHVYEFYGGTESNFGLCNLMNKIGACGFLPILLDPISPITIIKCREDGEPIRNAEGFCQKADIGEAGLILCRITSFSKFDGYSDSKATSKKILTNVYKENDRYFNSGDILSRDEIGFYYFKDRTGDTFRWKGENVSTTEVESILLAATKRDIAIYGVEIPGNEGRAGMAAVVDSDNTLDLDEFLKQCKSNLPSYSVPIFVRIIDNMPQTGTFKIQKANLVKEGYDINVVQDALYILNAKENCYEKLTPASYKDIQDMVIKV